MKEKEEIRQKLLKEISNLLKEGETIKVHVFKAKYTEPHHCDMYWDCYFEAIHNYKGNILYDSSGCYTSNLKEITSIDQLLEILAQMKENKAITTDEETIKNIMYSEHCWNR